MEAGFNPGPILIRSSSPTVTVPAKLPVCACKLPLKNPDEAEIVPETSNVLPSHVNLLPKLKLLEA